MKKFFDKFIQIFIIVLLSLVATLSVAYTIGILFFEEQTRRIADYIGKGLETPLGIIGGSTLTIGVVLFIIVRLSISYYLKNSKYGKESLDRLVEENNKLSTRAETLTKENKDLQEIAKVSLGQVLSENDKLYEFVEKALETSPNAKLNGIGKEMKDYKLKAQELADKKVEEIKSKFVEPTVKEKIDAIYLKLGESYEREETTND